MTLEKLLNILCEKGWKPFGVKVKSIRVGIYCTNYFFFEGRAEGKTLRELCAKESNLWQFVCENRMVGRGDRITKRKKVKDTDGWSGEEVIYYSVIGSYNETDYEYRLIETALTDEDKLEQFLLDNIKIEGDEQ